MWDKLHVELYTENTSGQEVITVTAGGRTTSLTVNVIDESVMNEEEENRSWKTHGEQSFTTYQYVIHNSWCRSKQMKSCWHF